MMTIALLVYSVMWFVFYTGMCAYFDYDGFNRLSNIQDQWQARSDMWIAGLFAAIPLFGFIAALILTCGFAYGFRWNVPPVFISEDKRP